MSRLRKLRERISIGPGTLLVGLVWISFLVWFGVHTAIRRPLTEIYYYWLELVFLPITIAALLSAARRAGATAVGNLFRGLAVAHGFWLISVILYFPGVTPLAGGDLPVRDVLYGLYYVAVLWALDAARIDARSAAVERRVHFVGSLALVVGTLVYVQLLSAGTLGAARLLYMVLDLYVALCLASLAYRSGSSTLRAVYLLLSLASGIVALAEGLEAAYDAGVLAHSDAPALDVFWLLVYAPLLLATRIRLHSADRLAAEPSGARARVGRLAMLWSPLIAYAFAIPALHVLLYSTDLGSPLAERGRAYFVVGWLAAGAVLILIQQASIVRRLAAGDHALQRSYVEVRRLTAERERAAENERSRLARELRDELGQQLDALRAELSWLRSNRRAAGSEPERRLAEADAVLREALGFSHRLATDLRPAALDDLGLASAIEVLAEETARRSGLDVRFTTDQEDRSPRPEVGIALYRIAQESLTNALKHSGAKRIEVALRRRGECLELQIQDDGRGLDGQPGPPPRGLGLVGIRERAEALSGRVVLGRGLGGRGLSVAVTVPFSSNEPEVAAPGRLGF